MRLFSLVAWVIMFSIFKQCKSSIKVDKGVICIQDSVSYPGDSSRNIYVFYRDFGLMGRGGSTYISIEKEGKLLNEDHWFYADNGIMLIKRTGDSLLVFTATTKPNYIESPEIRYRVIVDTQTWKYPPRTCHPVRK
jgi:hypothetical protein